MRTISYKVSYEKLISRLPGLFAYLEIDKNGTSTIVKATKGKQGNYGKIVANVICPDFNNGEEYICGDGTILKLTNGEKTYRTIVEVYYKAISDKEWDRDDNGQYEDEFLNFVETGIGLKYIGLSQENTNEETCGVRQVKKYPLAPDYIYLGESQTLLNKMVKMKKQLDFLSKHTEICNKDKKYYEHLKNEYEQSNGDKLINVLYDLVYEAESVANDYLAYTIDTNGLSLQFNVNLVNTIKDLGMVTPYIKEWVAGQRYYEGDVVYFVDDNGYGMSWTFIPTDNNDDVKTDEMGRKYTEGHFNENTEIITFDENNWKPQTLNWVSRNKRYICPQCGTVYNEIVDECKCGFQMGNVKIRKYVTDMSNTVSISGQCNSHLISLRRFETYMNQQDEAEYTEPYSDWLWYYRVGKAMNREEKYDEMGNIGVMYDDGDVYGKGIEAIINTNEKIGANIKYDDKDYVINLAVWGDVITNISAVNDEASGVGTLTITYVLGGHLKAQRAYQGGGTEWYSVDDDGNYIYYFGGFSLDDESEYGKNMGVKYTDTYIYYKGNTNRVIINNFEYGNNKYYNGEEITKEEYDAFIEGGINENCFKRVEENVWTLVEDGLFDDYVNGKYDKGYIPKDIEDIDNYYKLYDKMPFYYDLHSYKIKIGNCFKEVPYILTNFSTNIDIRHVDIEDRPLIRYDYYNGVSFQPTVNEDPNIERGVTQAFEKHIKLGEIKTFEDFENYANGGFFIISKEDIDLG